MRSYRTYRVAEAGPRRCNKGVAVESERSLLPDQVAGQSDSTSSVRALSAHHPTAAAQCLRRESLANSARASQVRPSSRPEERHPTLTDRKTPLSSAVVCAILKPGLFLHTLTRCSVCGRPSPHTEQTAHVRNRRLTCERGMTLGRAHPNHMSTDTPLMPQTPPLICTQTCYSEPGQPRPYASRHPTCGREGPRSQ